MQFIINQPEELKIEASMVVNATGNLVLRLNGESVLCITPDGLLRKLSLFGSNLPILKTKKNRIIELDEDGNRI